MAALPKLLESMTTSGKAELPVEQVRELQQICKLSSAYISSAFEILFKQLQTKHAEVRFSCFQIISLLFEKSSLFRRLLLNDFDTFLELVTGYSYSKKARPLPPPDIVAQRLRETAISTVNKWAKVYEAIFPRLEVAVRFLNNHAATSRRQQEDHQNGTASRKSTVRSGNLARHAQQALDEFEDRRSDFEECVAELRNSIHLLIPRLEDFMQTGEDSTNQHVQSNPLRFSKLTTVRSRELTIEVSDKTLRAQRSLDNGALIDGLAERLKQVNESLLPELRKWLQVLQKAEGFDECIKQCISLKNGLTELQNEASVLGVEAKTRRKVSVSTGDIIDDNGNDDEDGGEFLDVDCSPTTRQSRRQSAAALGAVDRLLMDAEFGGLDLLPGVTSDAAASSTTTTTRPAARLADSKNTSLNKNINSILHPEPATADLKQPEQQAIPTVPFGLDLKYWGREEQLSVPELGAPLDAVWSMQSGDKSVPAELAVSARTRTFVYKSEWKPVEHTCRVPLTNGKLCPRQDRYKCPLHGVIIPRDAVGQPLDAEQAEKLTAAQRKGVLGHMVKRSSADVKPWQDAELLRDIEAQTGQTLSAGSRRSSRAQRPVRAKGLKRYANLSDITTEKNTVNKRLTKKLLDKATVKRVGEHLDAHTRNQNSDKFHQQWNYAMNK